MKHNLHPKRSHALLPTVLSLSLGALALLGYIIYCYFKSPEAVSMGYVLLILYACAALLGTVIYRFVNGIRQRDNRQYSNKRPCLVDIKTSIKEGKNTSTS